MSTPENLRTLRESLGLTQAELAQRAGMEQTTISALERGKVSDPRMTTMQGLVRGLKMSGPRVWKALKQSVLAADDER